VIDGDADGSSPGVAVFVEKAGTGGPEGSPFRNGLKITS